MKSLLDALQEGRLIELPVNEKEKALEYLALIMEAIPDIVPDIDIVERIKNNELQSNTGLGSGVACPIIRTTNEGELLCAIGWSPKGIDYGSNDGKKVHLLFMYFVPNSQKSIFLKEISGLAKAIKETDGIESIEELEDLQEVRNHLLDWAEIAINKGIPDAKARMIKLEAKQSAIIALSETPSAKQIKVITFSILIDGNKNCIVLSQHRDFTQGIEAVNDLVRFVVLGSDFDIAGYRIFITSSKTFSLNRTVYDCVAVSN